jgi:hypothetical protein
MLGHVIFVPNPLEFTTILSLDTIWHKLQIVLLNNLQTHTLQSFFLLSLHLSQTILNMNTGYYAVKTHCKFLISNFIKICIRLSPKNGTFTTCYAAYWMPHKLKNKQNIKVPTFALTCICYCGSTLKAMIF